MAARHALVPKWKQIALGVRASDRRWQWCEIEAERGLRNWLRGLAVPRRSRRAPLAVPRARQASLPAAAAGPTYADLVGLAEPLRVVAEVDRQGPGGGAARARAGPRPGPRPAVPGNADPARAQGAGRARRIGRLSRRRAARRQGQAAEAQEADRSWCSPARSPGRPGELQLVAPGRAADVPIRLSRAGCATIIDATRRPRAPPRITGVRDVISVAGNLAGRTRNADVLDTAGGAPVSLTVIRRPNGPRTGACRGPRSSTSRPSRRSATRSPGTASPASCRASCQPQAFPAGRCGRAQRAAGRLPLHPRSARALRTHPALAKRGSCALTRRRVSTGQGEWPNRFASHLAGLGTVGAGVIRLIEANGALIARRAGRPIEIVAVSARDRRQGPRRRSLAAIAWEDDMTALAARDDVDVVVELVGGADGPALTLARATRSPAARRWSPPTRR